MRLATSTARGFGLGLAVAGALLTSTCGGGSDVAGPDRTGVSAATPTATSVDSGGGIEDAAAKTEVCHLDATTRTYKLLSIAPNSISSHMAHGDLAVSTRFPDLDGDNYGANVKCPAKTSTPTVANADDCNDSDGAIHPGAPDNTFDGVDNDCDGRIDEDAAAATCPCELTGGPNWVDATLDPYRSGGVVTYKECGQIDYQGFFVASLHVDFSLSSGQTPQTWFFAGADAFQQCGIIVDSTINMRPGVTAAQATTCQAQIEASKAYRDFCH